MSKVDFKSAKEIVSSTASPYVLSFRGNNYTAELVDTVAKTDWIGFLSGRKMRDFDELSATFSSALSFPNHYGNNWDALYDCMTDLAWMKFDRFILSISDADYILMREPNNFSIFIQLLRHAGEYWAKDDGDHGVWPNRIGSRPFHSILQFSNNPRVGGDIPLIISK